MHEKGMRYPISGVLVLEDGEKGLHVIFLSSDQSGISSTIPLDAITTIYRGKSNNMTAKPWIRESFQKQSSCEISSSDGADHLFFAIATEDTIWDLESKEEGTTDLWLASLSRITNLKPAVVQPPPPAVLPLMEANTHRVGSKIVPMAREGSQHTLGGSQLDLKLMKGPGQTRWGHWKRLVLVASHRPDVILFCQSQGRNQGRHVSNCKTRIPAPFGKRKSGRIFENSYCVDERDRSGARAGNCGSGEDCSEST